MQNVCICYFYILYYLKTQDTCKTLLIWKSEYINSLNSTIIDNIDVESNTRMLFQYEEHLV